MELGPQEEERLADPRRWALDLGISREAVELYLASEVIDLNIQSFIWSRVFRYDLRKRHMPGLLGARYTGQVDLPRIREAQIGGGIWSITTNPWRRRARRSDTLQHNLDALEATFASVPDQVTLVRTAAEYEDARAAGRHAAFIGVQGGNALDADIDELRVLEDGKIVCITLVHLSNSRIGGTSAPGPGRARGLSDFGREYVERLNELRVFVDLAHMNRRGFFDALEVHDKSLPVLVSHTGVSAVTPIWRNVDDTQLRAVADTGGTVGVIFHGGYLGGSYWFGGDARCIVNHIAHIIRSVGEDYASLGSDWDGLIIPPHDMRTCLELPRLVQLMLDEGLSTDCVRKVLGANFLRALRLLRG